MCELRKYANALGSPEKGAHAPRVAGLAAADLLATAAAAWVLMPVVAARRPGSWAARAVAWAVAFAILVAAGVLVHRVFCVDTALNRRLFGAGPRAPGDAAAGPGRSTH